MSDGDKSQQHFGQPDVSEAVADLRQRVGAASDSDLASILGVDRSAISQWKRRGKIPKSATLKVSSIELAAERSGRFSKYLASLPHDIVFYGRALAILYCGKAATYRADGENIVDPDRLRDAVTFFEEACAAGAYLLDRPDRGETAWEGFTYWANSQFLVKDMWETMMLARMVHLTDDRWSPQSESSIGGVDP